MEGNYVMAMRKIKLKSTGEICWFHGVGDTRYNTAFVENSDGELHSVPISAFTFVNNPEKERVEDIAVRIMASLLTGEKSDAPEFTAVKLAGYLINKLDE